VGNEKLQKSPKLVNLISAFGAVILRKRSKLKGRYTDTTVILHP